MPATAGERSIVIIHVKNLQLRIVEFEEGVDLPEHNHVYPQWGLVIDGEMELKINGVSRFCRKGDEYYIPVGELHCARFFSKTRVMDFFSEKSRYKPK